MSKLICTGCDNVKDGNLVAFNAAGVMITAVRTHCPVCKVETEHRVLPNRVRALSEYEAGREITIPMTGKPDGEWRPFYQFKPCDCRACTNEARRNKHK